jgi:hypothetical protein
MRTFVKALVVVGLGAALMPAAAPEVLAADVALTPAKRVKIVHRARVVRDYDGTPIVIRLAPPRLQLDAAGQLYETVPLTRETPGTYLNGQPVLPTAAALRRYRH